MSQIDLHKKIIDILTNDLGRIDHAEISDLIAINDDAKKYFFAKAGESWLDWLWENKFLDVIKKGSDDPTRYSYQTPEINYLVRIAEKVPDKVVNIILNVPINREIFNPEVVDRFLWICSILPAEQLARIVPKILEERWIPLMSKFNEWGFEYEKMLKTLVDKKDYDNFLLLAEAVLSVKTKEEFEKDSDGSWGDSPFYFKKLSYTKVFNYLASIDDGYVERALGLATKIMAAVVLSAGKNQDKSIFSIKDSYYFLDVDFFSLDLGESKHYSSRGDVQELVAILKILIQRLIKDKRQEIEIIKNIYDKYIESLPDSISIWRFRLFVMSLYPEVFKEKLKASFFRLFEQYPYHEVTSGAEYEKALRTGFSILPEPERRAYVKAVFQYFTKEVGDEKETEWNKMHGWEILSSICAFLTEGEKIQCEQIFGRKCDSSYQPEPSIREMTAGMVSPRGPISPEEFNKMPIDQIVKKLINEWSPENLHKKYKDDDNNIFSPRNAEGAGNLLKSDIPKRLQDYINNADLFFGSDLLETHYIYSFFRGIGDAIKNNTEEASQINWAGLISSFNTIKESGINGEFDNARDDIDKFDNWLANWDSVHSAMTDIVQLLIGEGEKNYVIDFDKYKDPLFGIIGYLLSYKDPVPADEEPKTAKMTMSSPGDKEPSVSDPHSMAINTVRGRAFQAFLLFIYRVGKGIDSEAKKLYENLLKNEDTRALMFMFGRFIPTFYFRDKEWLKELLPYIFSVEPSKSHLYLAAWEGYLTGPVYEEIFDDEYFQRLYERGLSIASIKEPHRRYVKDPEESLATHIALAFMHYKQFGFRHQLFKAFWHKDDAKHADFVGFLGRMFISGSNDRADKLLKENPLSKKRLENVWDFVLDKFNNPDLFVEFGYWMNLEKNIFNIPWLAERIKKTLQKSKGIIDWDYGLAKAIIKLATETPRDALEITRLYLLEGIVRNDERHTHHPIDSQWFTAVNILFFNPDTNAGTYKLIDDLIREGGSTFWSMEDIIKEDANK